EARQRKHTVLIKKRALKLGPIPVHFSLGTVLLSCLPRTHPALTPSAFHKEMSLTIKQRLASTQEMNLPQVVQLQDKIYPDHRSLQPFPPEVVFQNYTPGEVCEMPVVLRNRDQVIPSHLCPGRHRITPRDLGRGRRLRHQPCSRGSKDYFHQLLCITEREEFIVPICAIGARAILDFPDLLDFSECPVKYSSEKTLLVHNLGNRTARYHLSTQRVGKEQQKEPEHRSCCPAAMAGSGQDVVFRTSSHSCRDVINVLIHETAQSAKSCDTFLLVIPNQNYVTVCFQWKAFATQEEENQLKLSLKDEKDKLSDFLKERRVDTTHREHSALLTRTIQRERARLQGDPMLFNNDIFSLEPKEGEIRPNCSAEINVFFKPQAARVYEQAVYCDISGCETRLPLLLIGEGLGPQLHFSFEELDIGKVFVRAAHSYEVSSRVGVDPGGFRGSSELCGPVEFLVTWVPLPPCLCPCRGFVMGLTFHFDVPALHFGDVSFGFPRTLRCSLSNTSLAPMAFNLCIPEDGLGEASICSSLQIFKITHPSWRKGAKGFMKPREFNISPCMSLLSAGTARRTTQNLIVFTAGISSGDRKNSAATNCPAPAGPHFALSFLL
uniref:HYDIN/VesB/CFA65-like Ig-like domain-containing protein n=1 Tax=Corvus moneduloides TaxID=1196302 RepID=A0A8C3EC74_CORMO